MRLLVRKSSVALPTSLPYHVRCRSRNRKEPGLTGSRLRRCAARHRRRHDEGSGVADMWSELLKSRAVPTRIVT